MGTLASGALGIGVLVALVVVASAPGADWSNAQTVTVVTSDYRFEPSELTFRVGTVYRLHVENHGKDTHELTAPDFFKALEIRNPEILNAERTELLLQPGEQKDLFFAPRRAGRYPFSCADHDWAGMTGVAIVQ